MEERRPHRLFALAGALLHDSDSAIVAQTQKTLLHAKQRRETKYLFFKQDSIIYLFSDILFVFGF